jgi:hypothetical protein
MPKRERLSKTASGDHFIRRDPKGRIEEEVSVGRSLARDRNVKAKTTVKPGYGDQGDVARRATKKTAAKKSAAKKATAKKRAPAKKK